VTAEVAKFKEPTAEQVLQLGKAAAVTEVQKPHAREVAGAAS
jgi:hypothetical protein